MTTWDTGADQIFHTDGQAYVGSQIGVLHGDAHIYQVAGNAAPGSSSGWRSTTCAPACPARPAG